MFVRSSLIVVSLALPLMAQDATETSKASEAAFYKAYYLDKAEAKNKKSTAKAIELYTAFIASNKDHKLAGRAAANCVVLIYSTGKVKKAEAFAKTHDKLMAAAEAKDADGGIANGLLRGFGRGRGGRGGGDQAENPNQAMIDTLMAKHENAEGRLKTRLEGAINRLGGQRALLMARFSGGGRGGGFGGSRGGFGRGGSRSRGLTKPNIAEMSQEDAKKAVETMVNSAERLVDSMAQRGQADQADKLEAKLDKIQDLVDDGKMKEAQKVIDSIEVGGSSRGGDQGGRRRRGGDSGDGDGGERRRRRGGDGGDNSGGERRRRRG
jgi:hypothetical protein